ncbi:MAG: endonuclease/exonuclease/phosphatase family protein [Haloarculaceae archaeon]
MTGAFRVLSYNVRHAALDADEDAWERRRRDGVAGTIRVRRPDVVAVQEAGPDQLASLADRLPGYAFAGAGDRTGEYNPVGYLTDRWTLADCEVRWLAEAPDEAVAGWDAAFPRVATVARLRRTDGTAFTLFDVHFDHRGERAGVESARLVREWAADAAGPVVVAGDLNSTPAGEPYQILTGPDSRLRDARAVARHGHHGPSVSFTGYEPPPTGRRLDYLFVTDEFDVIQHAACPDLDRAGRFPSDHLPLLADLRL